MDQEIRRKILALLDQHRIMTIATLRPDGWPQATTVGYVNEGLTLYFLCGRDSQKAANLARDDRVSLTIDHDTPQVMEITGLSMAAHAQPVLDREEASKVLRMLPALA
jgi:nitroimidazol reductase NimA-like FMN-containing flavoprotein (pyridoxamine 5'-phosphate oxidase superfamily)